MNLSTIEQGEELLKASTPGPWESWDKRKEGEKTNDVFTHSITCYESGSDKRYPSNEAYSLAGGVNMDFLEADVELIVYLRNHASELLQMAREVKEIRSEGLSVYSQALEETVVRLAHGPLPAGVTDDMRVPFRQGWEMACSAILTLCLPRLAK